MKVTILISICLLLLACNKDFRPVRNVPKIADMNAVVIDETYKLYARQVYNTETQDTSKAHLAVNAEKDSSSYLIEVNYILYSKVHGQLIYIPTKPDPTLLYYKDHPPRKDAMDIKRFSRFNFGKVNPKDKTHIEFVNMAAEEKNVWIIVANDDTIRIDRIIEMETIKGKKEFEYINEISADYALPSKITFIRHEPFTMLYDNGGELPNIPKLLNNTIYYTKEKNIRVYLTMDRPIKNNMTTVRFRKKRIHFPP